jgi:hypothetical protein
VALAVREKLRKLDEVQLKQELIEGYKASRDEDAILNRAWEGTTLEEWP